MQVSKDSRLEGVEETSAEHWPLEASLPWQPTVAVCGACKMGDMAKLLTELGEPPSVYLRLSELPLLRGSSHCATCEPEIFDC